MAETMIQMGVDMLFYVILFLFVGLPLLVLVLDIILALWRAFKGR